MKENKWISVKDKLPDFDVDVLCYYEINGKSEIHKCIAIGYVRSITKGKDYESAEWVDKEYNALSPAYWMPLPNPPETPVKP